jgi:hypothetical protein
MDEQERQNRDGGQPVKMKPGQADDWQWQGHATNLGKNTATPSLNGFFDKGRRDILCCLLLAYSLRNDFTGFASAAFTL